jgi:alkylation response protein AidB-like acyl-CoA dehydrogenase
LRDGVERFSREIRPIEERRCLDWRFDDRLVPLARDQNLRGRPVPEEYGGPGR